MQKVHQNYACLQQQAAMISCSQLCLEEIGAAAACSNRQPFALNLCIVEQVWYGVSHLLHGVGALVGRSVGHSSVHN